MKTADKELEQRKIQEIAADYRNLGYAVIVYPQPADLPPFLAGFRPDIVATIEGDNVVIAVKTQSSLTQAPYLPLLAREIQEQRGWRLELVVTNPEEETVTEETYVPLDESDIAKRVDEVQHILNAGHLEAALLLAWSTAEAALRILAEREGIQLGKNQPAYIVKNLAFLGAIEQQDYETLWRALQTRNSVVHGYQANGDTSHLTIRLIETIRRLTPSSRRLDETVSV